MSTEKIIDRVKKMLAIANDERANEGERDNAMRMAYNLLAKHNLTMADLPEEEKGEDRVRDETTICGDKWVRYISKAMSELFMCTHYIQHTKVSGKVRFFFVGRESNVATSMYMTQYLTRSITKEARARYGSATSRDGRSFGEGAATFIYRRVQAMLKAESEGRNIDGGVQAGALVLVSLRNTEETENQLMLQQQGVLLKHTKSRASSVNGDAYGSGREYGSKVSLNQQLAGGGKKSAGALR